MDLFENQISQPPNLDGTSFLQNFKNDVSNIKKCQEYLKDQSCSENLQIILSSVLLDFVKNSDDVRYLSQIESDFSITDWCLNILLENYEFLSKPTIRTISLIFANIVYNLWNSDMDEKFQSIVKDQSEDQSELYLNPFCQLNIMKDIIFIFSQEYIDNLKHKDMQKLIFSNQLIHLYKIAKDYISSTDDPDINNIGLQVIFHCYCFGELSFFAKCIGSFNHILTPQTSIERILSVDNVIFLFQIFIKTQDNYALKSLCCILKMKNSTFTVPIFQDIINACTEYLPNVLSIFLKIENPDIIYLIDLICSYSIRLTDAYIKELKDPFVELIRIIFEFSLAIFDAEKFLKENLRMYSNLMKFWGIISNHIYESKEYPEHVLLLFDQINEITKKYVFTLLQLVLSNDPEILDDIFYDEDDESLVSPFILLMSSHVIDISKLILEIFDDYLENLKNDQLALSLFLRLSTLMLIKTQSSIFEDIKSKKETLFNQSIKIIEFSTQILQSDPKEMNFNLELNILIFIKKYKKFFDDFPTQTIVELIYRAIISLQVFCEEDLIVQTAIKALKSILKIDVKDDKDYADYKKVCSDLLENFAEFPFMKEKEIKNKTQKKNKFIFINTIYNISLKYESLYYIFDFLTGLLKENDIYNLIISLTAILSNKKSYFYKDVEMWNKKIKRTDLGLNNDKDTIHVYNWLLPDNVSYFVENGKNTDLMNLILKFWQKMLKSNFNMKFFQKHSKFGILIFEAASSTIGSSIEFYLKLVSEKNEENDQIRFQLAKRISACSSLLLGRKYIMYDAYVIYNNPSLVNFLSCLANFLDNTDFKYIIDHPILFSSFCLLIQTIINKQLKYSPIPLFNQVQLFYQNLMNQHQITFYKNNDPVDIFNKVFYEFVKNVNHSKRKDIDDIKSVVHNCFCTAFCFLLEIVINEKCYYYLNVIKELIIHDNSLLNLFKTNFVKILSNPADFNDLYDKLIDNLPILMNPAALQNDFQLYFEKFIEMKSYQIYFHFTDSS